MLPSMLSDGSSPSTEKKADESFDMALSELGEPDKYFFVWRREGTAALVQSKRGNGDSPGFAKWTVQAADESHRQEDDEFYYCDEARVHFTGKRVDGTVFASTREDGLPLTFIIGQGNVMHGFSTAISSMQAGEKAVFTIPPELASTKSGCPASIPWNIPTDQTLRFDIELISLVTVTDILNNEGILKKIIKQGNGNLKPCDLDEVLVNYNACLEDGMSVSKSEGVEFNLAKGFFCPAFAHAVKTMTEGEEAVFIVKPEYGFGKQGKPSIGNEATVPPDATLYMYLQLMSYKSVIHIGEGQTIFKRTLRRGEPINNQAVVRVRLIGKLHDGVVFDKRGHEEDEPFEFIVDEEQVSDALEEAVLTMQEGEIALFTIATQHLQDQLVVLPPGSSVSYEIELVSAVQGKNPWHMSREEIIETAGRKEKQGDKLFRSSKFMRAYRRYYKAKSILMPRILQDEIDEEIEQMFVSFAFKAAECATQLQCYKQAKNFYDEILRHDPENLKAQQLARQPFPEDSLGIDDGTLYRGLQHEVRIPLSMSVMRLKHGRHYKYSGREIFVPPIKRPEAEVRPGHSPATRAMSDVNRS